MAVLLFLLSVILLPVAIILLIVKSVKKQPKKPAIALLLAAAMIFVGSLFLDEPSKQTQGQTDGTQTAEAAIIPTDPAETDAYSVENEPTRELHFSESTDTPSPTAAPSASPTAEPASTAKPSPSPTPSPAPTDTPAPERSVQLHDYVININTGKFHYPDCSSVKDIKNSNRKDFTGTREELIAQGYSPCGRCHP